MKSFPPREDLCYPKFCFQLNPYIALFGSRPVPNPLSHISNKQHYGDVTTGRIIAQLDNHMYVPPTLLRQQTLAGGLGGPCAMTSKHDIIRCIIL